MTTLEQLLSNNMVKNICKIEIEKDNAIELWTNERTNEVCLFTKNVGILIGNNNGLFGDNYIKQVVTIEVESYL